VDLEGLVEWVALAIKEVLVEREVSVEWVALAIKEVSGVLEVLAVLVVLAQHMDMVLIKTVRTVHSSSSIINSIMLNIEEICYRKNFLLALFLQSFL
jgi:hypothetical protein